MATAAFSMPSDPRARISVSGRSKNPGNATSAAADEALRRLIDDRRRRHKYGSEPRRRESALGGAIGAVSDTIGGSVSRLGLPMWLLRVGVAAVVAIVLSSAVLLRGGPAMRHSVDGRVVFEGRPLSDATLEFHLTSPSATGEPFWMAIYTSADGTFRRDASAGLPSGTYAVVVKSGQVVGAKGRQKPATIPAKYKQSVSTPLSVEIKGSTAALDLVVRK